MTVPTSTYRIQFRNGMSFDRAATLVPYLKQLGISHLYASPVFTATEGSTHGYDVTDANEIDPAIGGREGFDRLVQTLKSAGLGIILDIVPNHMASSLDNRWWKDVIEHGQDSRYARHFDIDWSRRLTLPFLGDDFDKELEAGKISVKTDLETGKPALFYEGSFYPLNPASYAGLDGSVLETINTAAIAELHERQPYRLTSWRDASRDLSYRRFFEVAGLVGVRVEDPAVFDDTHRLILELVRDGSVDGLRVDHVDGLADPKAYLERLRREAGPECHITVEKILGPEEQLPKDWPVFGTTGYEFIAALSNLFVANDKLGELRAAYEACLGEPVEMPKRLRDAKLLMAERNFAGEFNRLLEMARDLLGAEPHNRQPDDEKLRSALRELLVAFPVYRTYGTPDGFPNESKAVLDDVVETIKAGAHAPDADALASLERLLSEGTGEVACEFRTRFQQLTGPLMAKSVEDTLFYRQNMALALNEVGAEPLQHAFSVNQFHDAMAERLRQQPDALSATSTHDTKRGEDARARLYAITEQPGIWANAVKRWQAMNAAFAQTLDDGPAPEPAVEWLIYQALAGAWPVEFEWTDEKALKELEERFLAYLEKALREAKLRTDWGENNGAYEDAVAGYVRQLLAPQNSAFLKDFNETLKPFVKAGLSNSLAQTLIKLTAPGIPDIYQGSEGFDLSLVDPDNRRMPDYDTFQKQLERGSHRHSSSLELKQHLIATVLPMRQKMPQLFGAGTYVPLVERGEGAGHFVAFARVSPDAALITIAQRMTMQAEGDGKSSYSSVEIALPPELANHTFVDVLTKAEWQLGETINPAQVAGCLGVALLKKR